MPKWATVDDEQFQAFAESLHRAADGGFKEAVESEIGKSAQIMLKEIKARTPVDSGMLRRRWRIKAVSYQAPAFLLTLTNSAEYASFVENGHRQKVGQYVPAIGKQLKKPWVDGQFMMRDGVMESMPDVQDRLAQGVAKAITEIFGGD
ncbi:HK97 gp10 family phage protein [Lacticaseibacillus sp. N501-2]|uniref:HK97 gp10 family phage protein n=1 Tax=Lacticaseibacillus salsurae TaxID=3367729 RepID=UPI0038B40AE8